MDTATPHTFSQPAGFPKINYWRRVPFWFKKGFGGDAVDPKVHIAKRWPVSL
jgi:hypothetical protein